MLESYVDSIYQQRIMEVFSRVVEQTPQWSGHLARNWFITTIGNTTGIDESAEPAWGVHGPNDRRTTSFYKMGDSENTSPPMQRAEVAVRGAHYLSPTPVNIYNNVYYAEEVDIGDGPDGPDGIPRKIRPVNLIDGVVQMIYVNFIRMKFEGWVWNHE